jgi:uncharacterized protein HemX
MDILKQIWEWIVFAAGLVLAYVLFRPQQAPEKPQGLEKREEEARQKQEQAEAEKQELKGRLETLEEEQDRIENIPTQRDMNEENIRAWFDTQFGS